MAKKKVIVIGGGFGGLNVVQGLKKADCEILLIDKTNHHLFQPLLYQVATAGLSPANIAFPLREILRKQKNATVIMAEVTSIDVEKKHVHVHDGAIYPYDILVVATGAHHSYFGHPEWEGNAPGLKTLLEALTIRDELLLVYEKAEKCENIHEGEHMLRFAIVGGGPTGVEMAGAIAEIATKSMSMNFRKIKPEFTKIYLIEGESRILGSYTPELSEKAKEYLEKMGVKVILNKRVTNITPEGIWFGKELLPVSKVIWAAGNQVSSMLGSLQVPLDKAGRVIVQNDLTIPGHPEVFVIGDAALVKGENGEAYPGIAPVAIQEGRYVAKVIKSNTQQDKRDPFRYHDKGQMATVGKNKAVAMLGKFSFSGFLAWSAWCMIHIWYLISFANRLIVMIQWMFWYVTGQRTVRLILKDPYQSDKKDESPF